jgi:hypothetical protein
VTFTTINKDVSCLLNYGPMQSGVGWGRGQGEREGRANDKKLGLSNYSKLFLQRTTRKKLVCISQKVRY